MAFRGPPGNELGLVMVRQMGHEGSLDENLKIGISRDLFDNITLIYHNRYFGTKYNSVLWLL